MKLASFSLYIISQLVALNTSNLPFVEADAPTSNLQRCLTEGEFDANVDYFPDKFDAHETTDLLSITYHKSYKIIENKYHNITYLLYQCGSEPPEEEVNSGKHHLVLSVPHTGGIAVTETPQITPLEILGKRREITGYFGDPKFISSPCFDYMLSDDNSGVDTVFNPDDPWGDTTPLEEAWLNDNPDAVILRGIFSEGDGARDLAFAGSQEKTNVATFDWIGYHAALFNLEKTANMIIAETEERYTCSANNAASLSADMDEEEKPTILWAYLFTGTGWSIAECPTPNSAYYCEYANHCNANILSRPENLGFNVSYGGPEVYWYLSDEELLELGKDADAFIYPGPDWEQTYESKKDILDQFKSVQNKKVYDPQGKGGTYAWNEQRLSEYDVVALDFCDVAGLSNPEPPLHVRTWLRNVYTETVASPGACDPDKIDEPYVPQGASCTPISSQSALGDGKTSASSRSYPLAFITSAITAAVASLYISVV